MLRNYFLTTIRTLRQNTLYTALSVSGIALTFVFVCILFMIVRSDKDNFIPPNYTKRTWKVDQYFKDDGTRWSHWISKENYETWIPKMQTPEISLVTALGQGTVVINDFSMMLVVCGISDNYYDVCRFKFLRGRPLNKQEIVESLPVTVLDRNIANLYFGKKEDPIGKYIELYGNQYRVVGVVENASLFGATGDGLSVTIANMWIPIDNMKNMDGKTYHLSFTAKDVTSIADTQAEFIRALNETSAVEGITHRLPEDSKKTLAQSKTLFNAVGVTMSLLILMLIPALNILSLNVCKSVDRSEEIAIRKAFGAPRHTIFMQLLIENTLVTLVGAVIGMCITPLLLSALDRMILDFSFLPMTLALHFDWVSILLIACPCVLLFSFLSGSIPAWITAKREIVNILKGETQ